MNAELTNTIVSAAVSVGAATAVGLLGVFFAYSKKRLGLQETQTAITAEVNLRDSLQATLVTAVGMSITGKHEDAVNYVVKEAGAAVAHYGLTPEAISNLIVNKAAAWAGVTPNA